VGDRVKAQSDSFHVTSGLIPVDPIPYPPVTPPTIIDPSQVTVTQTDATDWNVSWTSDDAVDGGRFFVTSDQGYICTVDAVQGQSDYSCSLSADENATDVPTGVTVAYERAVPIVYFGGVTTTTDGQRRRSSRTTRPRSALPSSAGERADIQVSGRDLLLSPLTRRRTAPSMARRTASTKRCPPARPRDRARRPSCWERSLRSRPASVPPPSGPSIPRRVRLAASDGRRGVGSVVEVANPTTSSLADQPMRSPRLSVATQWVDLSRVTSAQAIAQVARLSGVYAVGRKRERPSWRHARSRPRRSGR
jgi:hypothetical protein